MNSVYKVRQFPKDINDSFKLHFKFPILLEALSALILSISTYLVFPNIYLCIFLFVLLLITIFVVNYWKYLKSLDILIYIQKYLLLINVCTEIALLLSQIIDWVFLLPMVVISIYIIFFLKLETIKDYLLLISHKMSSDLPKLIIFLTILLAMAIWSVSVETIILWAIFLLFLLFQLDDREV